MRDESLMFSWRGRRDSTPFVLARLCPIYLSSVWLIGFINILPCLSVLPLCTASLYCLSVLYAKKRTCAFTRVGEAQHFLRSLRSLLIVHNMQALSLQDMANLLPIACPQQHPGSRMHKGTKARGHMLRQHVNRDSWRWFPNLSILYGARRAHLLESQLCTSVFTCVCVLFVFFSSSSCWQFMSCCCAGELLMADRTGLFAVHFDRMGNITHAMFKKSFSTNVVYSLYNYAYCANLVSCARLAQDVNFAVASTNFCDLTVHVERDMKLCNFRPFLLFSNTSLSGLRPEIKRPLYLRGTLKPVWHLREIKLFAKTSGSNFLWQNSKDQDVLESLGLHRRSLRQHTME